MAHFAELNSNNVVINVFKVENVVIIDENDEEKESLGIAFLQGLFGSDKIYKQTSFNCNFRKNYARIGDIFDSSRNAFISNQPFPSWSLNEASCRYEPPIPHPDPNGTEPEYFYSWDEDAYQADNSTGWVKIATK
tara:strand:+ start:2230 stop:2634 length:405 start_codon:yes stop_codon:yes gene_type:complete